MFRLLSAVRRFEDSPLGLLLGAVILFAAPIAMLGLNEQGVR